jgi:hypothetical protein
MRVHASYAARVHEKPHVWCRENCVPHFSVYIAGNITCNQHATCDCGWTCGYVVGGAAPRDRKYIIIIHNTIHNTINTYNT